MPILLLIHLVVGIVVVALGDRLGRRGFAVAAVAPVVVLVWAAARAADAVDGTPVVQRIDWVPSLGIGLDLRVDAFSLVMIALVSGIGLLVCVYALGYFSHPKPGTGRLAGLMTLFAGSMLGVVMSDHLLALFVFWELTSITSYLLIGNDDRSRAARDAALSAILITGGGGLAMLAGLVLIGRQAGTYRLSELVTDVPNGDAVTVGLLLVLLGAFTKSAQLPFQSWLPGAMVAPTPISTYLHAATMVKAGVYLVARLSPLFAATGGWRGVVVAVGSLTMLYGGWRALRQHDLKLLLAFGTISQLGFLMVLLGAGLYDVAQAGVVLLLAHGAFKATLFMVVGIVDHQTGTRDVRRIDGLGRAWRPVVVVSVLGAASMAGLPPLVGFIGKEKALDAALQADIAGATAAVVAITLGSILTVAYSGRFVLGVLGRLSDASAGPPATGPAPSVLFLAPAVVLAAFGVVAGLLPVLVDEWVRDATTALYPDSSPKDVVLWAGVNAALGLSAVIVAAGAVMMVAHRRVEALQTVIASSWRAVPSADRVFWAAVAGTLRGAKRTAAIVQSGSLPIYLLVVLGVAAVAPIIPAVAALDELPDGIETWMHVPIGVVILAAAIGATVVTRRIAAALLLGGVGYGMAAMYVVQGAPDLALTQLAIETLATTLFVLVLRFLPKRFVEQRPVIVAPLRVAVSTAVAGTVFVLALVAAGARSDVPAPPVSQEMVERAVPDGKGANVVNVILVDFRGVDTLGEITVLAVAGLGAVALARTARRRPADAPEAPDATVPGVRVLDRLPVLEAASRVLFASIVVLSLYFLFAGHNQPGGGFVGGLTAGAAISLRYVAGGVAAVRSSFRLRPWTILGGGLLVSVTTAIVPLALGESVLEHALFERDLPVLGVVKATSALPFDIGVYFVVVGLVLMAFEAFGGDVAHVAARDTARLPAAAGASES